MPEFDDKRWLSQEAARQGLGGDAIDRAVALALRTTPAAQLPADFAAQVAAQAMAEAAHPSPAFEQALVVLAAGLLMLALGLAVWWAPGLSTEVRQALSEPVSSGWAAWLVLALLLAALPPHLLSQGKRS